jgi:arginine dihydrolase
MTQRLIAEGHLIDSGILTNILNLIVEEGEDYNILSFDIGKTNAETSRLEIELVCSGSSRLTEVSKKLINIGCYEAGPPAALWRRAEKDACVPEDFYSTTNHRTEVWDSGGWLPVAAQRMDAVIVREPAGLVCRKLRDVRAGDEILCGSEAVHVHPPQRDREGGAFAFMNNEVSSERSVESVVRQLADEFRAVRERGGRTVVVAGPVVIHTGGAGALSALIREGWVDGLLSGNALAVHDVESAFYGTSLGVDLASGRPTHEGHKNHMRAINRINGHGGLREAVAAGDLVQGVMYETIRAGIPFCLAGSIRDDGPLPDTEMDLIRAQAGYAAITRDADLVLMLSSMLHAIGTGNMLPSWVKTVCVDINPAVVTKLVDRGSAQAVGVVNDVGLFLNALARELT